MDRKHITALLLTLTLLPWLSPSLFAADKHQESSPAKTMALPTTHKLTLTLEEKGETFSFSMTVASRHFAMNLGEKDIAFRGRLWQSPIASGELLDYTVEYTQWVDGPETGNQRRGSTCMTARRSSASSWAPRATMRVSTA